MLNKAILMGRLTRDPELRHTQANMPVCSFSLAIDRDRKGPNGERQTDFIDCVAWSRTAEFVQQWFTKGMMAIVVGRIQSRSWEDKNGGKRVSIEVNCDEVSFGETKKSRDGYAPGASYDAGAQPYSDNRGSQVPAPSFDLPTGGSDFAELADDDESDVPF
ncbi:MAG: single-stranded DNA-binding protein [Intestinibacillus sp.]